MFKRAKVVMLPTNQKAPEGTLYLQHNQLRISQGGITNAINQNKNNKSVNHQHLYILSDEEIKAGYLAMNMYNNTNTIFKITKVLADGYEGQKLNEPNIFYGLSKTLKKIIATTDSSLKVFIDKAYMNFGETECLPQPSQSFIEKYVEKYNKGEQITDILVEYEFDVSRKPFAIGSNPEHYNLKVNLKDNTITIKPVKENWNRSEVLHFLGEAFRLGKQVQRSPDYYSLCDPLADLAKKLL